MSSGPRVVVLGGGPAGCGAAFRLCEGGGARATLIEQRSRLGGNAGSFRFAGQWVDYGSHRLHHSCRPDILAELRRLLGEDLLWRPRNGRIRLRGRWIRFPLQATDLLLRLDRRFAIGAARDLLLPGRQGPDKDSESFASVLREQLGPTVCEGFYFPFARKLWGLEPEEIDAEQARRRVSANSPGKLLRRLLRPSGRAGFYYPRRGYGQLSEALGRAAEERGGLVRLGTRVKRLRRPQTEADPWGVEVVSGEKPETLPADHVFSTLPLPRAAAMIDPPPPSEILAAAARLEYRAMVLVYLQIEVARFSSADAHYFPEADVRLTRLSEPKNYSGTSEPAASTALCAEIPCSPESSVWRMSDEELARLLEEDLARCGLPLPRPPASITSKRLRHAYPVYRHDFARALGCLERWLATLPRFVTYGRQGLFAHDNAHHALAMAWAAVDCLGAEGFDDDRWARYRLEFERHVVED